MPDLQAFAENIWIVEGPLVRDMGFTFTTRMTVVKLSDGSVWVESPVPTSFEILKRITEIGPVRYLIAATPRHVWRLEGWHTLFPEAQLWTAATTILTLQKAHLSLAGILGDGSPKPWKDDLDQLVFKGNPFSSEVFFFHKRARTVILGDLIQNNPVIKGEPLRNALFKFEGALFPHGGVGLEIKLSFFNRNLARQSLSKLLSWDFDKLIIAHGPCIEKDAKVYVERAFRWLAP